MSQPVAIIVGVGPGLGMALVRRCVAGGMQVAMAARDGDKLRRLLQPPTTQAHPYPCDASDPAAVSRLFAQVGAELGSPDLVVFNAGAFAAGGILDIKPSDFERCWRVGCFGGFLVGQEAARAMVPRGRGTIMFTGATASLRGSARFVNLAAPKFGLRAVAQSMARELGPQGIHVAHVIIDGGIGRAKPGEPPMLTPSAIAETYWQLYLQPREAWTQELDLRPYDEKF